MGYLLVDHGATTRVGFIVSKAVGNSVSRHRVTRRLRHVMRDRLAQLPTGSAIVVRALAPAVAASSAELAGDVDAMLHRLGTVGQLRNETP